MFSGQLETVECQVVYKSIERLRIRIPQLSEDTAYTTRLRQLIEQLGFITNIRVNPAAKSIAVEYKTKYLPIELIQDKILSCVQLANLAEALLPTDEFVVETKAVAQPEHTEPVEYEIIHQNPRRVRLRIPRLAEDAAYVRRIKSLVPTLDYVTDVHLNPTVQSIAVEFDHTAKVTEITAVQEKLFTVIQQAAYLEIQPINLTSEAADTSDQEIDYWERLGLPAISLGLSLGAMVGLPFPQLLIAGSIFVAAVPVFKRALDYIQQERQLNIDFLDGLAISLHNISGNYFPAAFMLGLIEGGEVIRDLTARGSERASLDLLECLGKYARVERNGQEIEIPVKEIIKGDRVIVYPGDQIPVDGYILQGTGLIDQCKLTGESVPVTRTVGDEVFASTLVVDGNLCILTERTGNNTRAGVIVSLMQSAPVHDTRVENYAAVVANQMVVPTLLTGVGVGMFSGDISRMIALLTLDLGTGIRVSVPTTILSALTYAARNGVFIRSGRAIEILSRIDTVVFDKTGTLTQGHAGVTGIKITDAGISEQEVLTLAATAEQGLTHPVAQAIISHAQATGITLGKCEAWEYRVGLGVVATIDGMQLLVGSPRLMAQENISLDYLHRHYPDLKSSSNSLVYVAGDGQLLGVILYSDPPRPESKGVLQELQTQGISAYMLSGDVTRVAKAIASELGIEPEHVYAEAFPERKVEVVKSLHDSGKTVAFCGDGINDSAALAYADVSISFAGATDIARETADVVLMENDLRGLTHAIKIAKQAMEIIWQNVALVAVPNVSAVLAGVLFALDPVLAIIINNGSAILAELNGLRPLLGPEGVTPLQQSVDAATLEQQQLIETVVVELKEQSDELKLPSYQLRQSELAKRLGLNARTLQRQRSKPNFTEWSKAKDPEGIAWSYDSASKSFRSVQPLADTAKLFASGNGHNFEKIIPMNQGEKIHECSVEVN